MFVVWFGCRKIEKKNETVKVEWRGKGREGKLNVSNVLCFGGIIVTGIC